MFRAVRERCASLSGTFVSCGYLHAEREREREVCVLNCYLVILMSGAGSVRVLLSECFCQSVSVRVFLSAVSGEVSVVSQSHACLNFL